MRLESLAILAEEGVEPIAFVFGLAVLVFFAAAMWKVFVKAGQPGWGCIVPFYNVYLLCKIAGRPGWWLVLYFIPVVSLVVSILVMLDIASLGRSARARASGSASPSSASSFSPS